MLIIVIFPSRGQYLQLISLSFSRSTSHPFTLLYASLSSLIVAVQSLTPNDSSPWGLTSPTPQINNIFSVVVVVGSIVCLCKVVSIIWEFLLTHKCCHSSKNSDCFTPYSMHLTAFSRQ